MFTCQPAIQLLSKLMVMISVEVLTSAVPLCAQLLLPPLAPHPHPPPVLPHSELMWMNDTKVLTLAVWLCAQLLSACHSAPLQVDVGVGDQYESLTSAVLLCAQLLLPPPPPPPHLIQPHSELMLMNSMKVLTLTVRSCA